ncbi:MAG TPA: hypothetical protein DIC34_11925, partial [Treponema sp.]|nr:hypothetical protein [Treponema sp.]
MSNEKYAKSGIARVAIFCAAVSLILSSCENLLGGDDLKTRIKEEVKVANAEKVMVDIHSSQNELENAFGATNPQGKTEIKIDVPFVIDASPFPGNDFLSWSVVGEGATVEFADATSRRTSVIIKSASAPFAIVAEMDEKPTADFLSAPLATQGVPLNQSLTVSFSKVMDLDSFVLGGNVTVSNKQSGLPPVDLSDAFSISLDESGYDLTLSFLQGRAFDKYATVTLTIGATARDSLGLSLLKEKEWFFITGKSVDDSAPVLITYELKPLLGSVALEEGERVATRALVVNLNFDDTDSKVMMTLTETGDGESAVREETYANREYLQNISYILATADDGEKTITVELEDTFGHRSEAETRTIVLDTTAPFSTDFVTTAEYVISPVANVTQSVTDGAAGLGCDPAEVEVSFTSNGGSSWTEWTPALATHAVALSPSAADGEYGIWARYRDDLGNATASSSSYSRASVRLDTVAPTITDLTFGSDGTDARFARIGRIVTLSFVERDSYSGIAATPVVSIAGHTVAADVAEEIQGGGLRYEAIWTMTSDDIEGDVPYTVSIVDIAGNVTETSRAEDPIQDASVFFNKTAPSISGVSLSSVDTGDEEYAKTGDTVRIAFTATEGKAPLAGLPIVRILDHVLPEADIEEIGGSGITHEYEATYVLAEDDSEGVLTFYIKIEDTSRITDETTNGALSNVLFDRTAPTVTNFAADAGAAFTNAADRTATIGFDSSDALSGGLVYQIGESATPGSTWSPAAPTSFELADSDGTHTVYLHVKDAAGNVTTVSDSIFLDRVDPTLATFTLDTGAAYSKATNRTLTLAISASDPGAGTTGSGALTYQVTENAVDTGTYGAAPTTFALSDIDGLHTVYLRVKDAAGNVIETSRTITLDRLAPTVSFVSMSSNNGEPTYARIGTILTMEFTASDAVSGLAATPVTTIASRPAYEAGTGPAFTSTYTVATGDPEGVVAYAITAVDAAGNTRTVTGTDSIVLDRTTPVVSGVSFLPASGWRRIGQTVVMTISAGESGLSAGIINVNGKATTGFTDHENGIYTVTYTVVEEDVDVAENAQVAISVMLYDPAGNPMAAAYETSPAATQCPAIDAHRPTVIGATFSWTDPNVDGIQKIGEVLTLNFTTGASETDLVATTVKVNGQDALGVLTGSGTSYSKAYTVLSGHTDRTSANAVPVEITLTDAAGNSMLAPYATAPAASPKIDANYPTVTGSGFSPASGWRKISDVLTLNFTTGASETG